MSRLSDLLKQAQAVDAQLGADLESEILALTRRRTFGLVFEEHQPEAVEMHGRPIRRGDKVRILPARGSSEPADRRLWRIDRVERTESQRNVHLVELDAKEPEKRVVTDDLVVVVAEFRDRIYPGLVETDRVENSAGKPFHTVINAENYHALEMLTYTHQESVDLIYIDPPYNTGGKFAWLYNDNYVDGEDEYQHSKWLAFMDRRLRVARELLKPSGAIMVSIGDDEQHRLRMLMEQIFGVENHVAQLAVEMSTTSGPKTTNAQQGTIVKNVEYVLIYRKSPAFDTEVRHTPLFDGIEKWDANYPLWLNDNGTTESVYQRLDEEPEVRADIERFGLTRAGGKGRGTFVGASGMDLLLAASLPAREFILNNLARIGRTDTPPVSGRNAEVPIGGWVEHQTDGRTYRLTRSSKGKVWQIYTLDRNYRTSDDYVPRFGRTVIRGDLWRGFHSDMGHVSNEGGVGFANGKKPLRLIKQLVRWANNSPDAVVLDFFAGSGTTAHAIAAMNADDGGRRRSIVVTNNELSRTDSVDAAAAGHRAGDPEWESRGVYESKTKPRLLNAFRETAANAEFFNLTYEAPLTVRHNRAFERIAPMLWLRAGSRGPIIADLGEHGWGVAESYGVLTNLDQVDEFITTLTAADSVEKAFIVTDDDSAFQMVCRELPQGVLPIRLYESYLQNFEINTGRTL
ncbi:site-specific DNA-methyltransferase [Microbacterium sp. NPDC058269]|uniref:site-specific DNA-methyltransferase n=1 Tax=Microbacterium sp. NPDC058269 TaxID=3346414 RepID=UPI0036DD1621